MRPLLAARGAARRRRQVLRRRRRRPADARPARGVLPRAQDGRGRVHRRRRGGARAHPDRQRGRGRGRPPQRRRAAPLRQHRPRQGQGRRDGGAAAGRGARGARLQVPPQRPGVPPERPVGLPALRGARGARRARPLPQRSDRNRLGAARRRRHPAQVLQPAAPRRRGRRLPRPHDHHRPPVVPLAGRGAGGGLAQAEGLHRPVGLVAEVLPAAAGEVRQQPAQAQGHVRLGLPADLARPLARRLRDTGHQGRGAAADPQGERAHRAGPRRSAPREAP